MSRRFAFITVDVFTDCRFGGNPLAVFPDARGLSDEEMQALAAEFNLSETTFVLPPADPANSARIRIFTRTREMPFAGHPNVGTGFVLADRARDCLLRFEELAGLVEVRVERDAAGAVTGTTITAPEPLRRGAAMPVALLADCLGLDASEVQTAVHPPVVASVGNPFVIAEVTSAALARVVPNLAGFQAAAAAFPAGGRLAIYAYAWDDAGLRARMFAPLGGTVEDAATGSAATPLAALLLSLGRVTEAPFDIRQGIEMGRPSLLRVRAWHTADGICAAVGGGCVPVMRGEVMLD